MGLQDFVLGAADGAAGAVGLLRRPFPVERMLAQARKRTGLSDFGDESFIEPLQRLLAGCVAESDLSVVGRIATHWDVTRFLGNLLRLRQAESRAPAILRERVEAPIFVTGLPRSGTSFLHALLMQDSDNMVPAVWETIHPVAEPEPGARDRRIAGVAQQLRAFERLAPEFRSLHPLEATSPQECSEITAHVFASLRFDSTYRVPSYRAWLDEAGHLEPYRFHRRFLQHLQHGRPDRAAGGGGRWALKCPDHVFALDEIRTVYPDARLVFVHRDPVKVLLSVARLTEVLRRVFTRRVNPAEIGRQESLRWHEGAQRMVAASRAGGFAVPPCHVHHLDLISDPLGTVAEIYRHFGLALPSQAAERIGRHVIDRPNGGYGAHCYRFEDHGLDPAAERERFTPYMAHFGIAPETGEARLHHVAPSRAPAPVVAA